MLLKKEIIYAHIFTKRLQLCKYIQGWIWGDALSRSSFGSPVHAKQAHWPLLLPCHGSRIQGLNTTTTSLYSCPLLHLATRGKEEGGEHKQYSFSGFQSLDKAAALAKWAVLMSWRAQKTHGTCVLQTKEGMWPHTAKLPPGFTQKYKYTKLEINIHTAH